VVAFAVSQRTKEIGIRIALGAVNRDIYQAVLGSRWRSIAVGLLIGVTVTMISFSAMSHLLRDVNFRNPMMYVITGALLVGVALAAMVVPARRATKVDPMVALRHE
jgi:ABC-type antimicrobial peptide transport system permease subunit